MHVDLHAVADLHAPQPTISPVAPAADSPPARAVRRGPFPVHPDGPRAELERLGNRIAELSARIQAATYELLVLIREFDERNGWSSCVSCAHWLSWRTGLAPGAAREHVRVARALANLPKLSDAMRRGVVSYSKVRAVTRVATPETEQTLLDVALAGTAAHVEQIVRGWRRVDRSAEQAEDRRRHETRSLRTWVDDDGMVVVRGRLTPEVGAVLRRALEAACDQARGQDVPGSDTNASAAVNEPAEELASSFAQRQADALGVVAESALAGGLDRGTAGDRYQVVVHVDADVLAEKQDVPAGTSPRDAGDRPQTSARGKRRSTSGQSARQRMGRASCPPAARGQAALDEAGGIRVSQQTARRLACDAAKVTMQHGPGGEILDVGRRTRTISPALRRALAARDRQCRFPGCQNRRCDAHPVRHWADGGSTLRRQVGILVDVHSVLLPENCLARTFSFLGRVRVDNLLKDHS